MAVRACAGPMYVALYPDGTANDGRWRTFPFVQIPASETYMAHQLIRGALIRHARGLIIALAVFGLSATAVFAGGGAHTADRTAAPGGNHPAVVAPTGDEGAEAQDEAEAPDAEETETPDADEAEAPDVDEVDAEDAEPSETPEDTSTPADAPDTHGALVSQAAAMPVPDGFTNRGAFVSCVARMNHGHLKGTDAETTPLDLTTTTVATCDATDETVVTTKRLTGHDRAPTAKTSHGKAGTSHGKG